jgi:predicted nucleic acid-binding protein
LSENVPLPEIARSREAIELLTANIELIALTEQVLERAATAFAVPLKTLDAIHLATALLWREKNQTDLAFATHDTTLARAARAAGFEVLGA